MYGIKYERKRQESDCHFWLLIILNQKNEKDLSHIL